MLLSMNYQVDNGCFIYKSATKLPFLTRRKQGRTGEHSDVKKILLYKKINLYFCITLRCL